MRSAALDHGREEDLRKDGAELAHAGAEAVSRTANACWEDFGRCDESCGVWAEVEEELREDVEDEEVRLGEALPCEPQDAEDDG